ncbi:hypothetical protein [Tropicimonas sp. S265A]|uniref:hypothetical protein n=1 Tax=Tropicimonas sp. S265A TaxID=3415134 RepID=UPI003C7AB665
MDLFLHLGAHRTGSTTLQMYAAARHAALRASDVTVWGPKQTRDGRFDGLIKAADRVTPALARDGRAACAALGPMMDRVGTQALVISEENMLGSMFANVRERSLYADAARRLARFRPAMAGKCRRIGLAIRSYDRHWTSSLAFVLRKDQRGTSPCELAELAAQPRRWRDVIADVATVYPEAEVLVWPFEALVDAPDAVLRALVGGRLDAATPARFTQCHHPSPRCADLRAALPEGAARASVAGDGAAWEPFDAETRAALRAAYAADIAWLRAGADGLARYIETPKDTSPEIIAGRPGQQRGTDHDQRQRRVG